MARGADGSFTAITWDDAIARLAAKVTEAGGKLAVLSGAGRGTFSDLLADWAGAAGGRVVRWEPFDHEPVRAANRQVFGLDQLPSHDFASAKYILSFGADFLDTWLSPTEQQLGFALRTVSPRATWPSSCTPVRAGSDRTQRRRVAGGPTRH